MASEGGPHPHQDWPKNKEKKFSLGPKSRIGNFCLCQYRSFEEMAFSNWFIWSILLLSPPRAPHVYVISEVVHVPCRWVVSSSRSVNNISNICHQHHRCKISLLSVLTHKQDFTHYMHIMWNFLTQYVKYNVIFSLRWWFTKSHCFVARQSCWEWIYEIFGVKCWCKNNDKYQVWSTTQVNRSF